MPRQLDPRIVEILEKYGENPRDTQGVIWDCHGTWVVYHKALERVAARAGIEFTRPEIIRSERDEAVILASGSLDGRTDWEIGEALIGVNYRVSGKQAAYVYAMATKRARDRLILKLVGLHGLLYSEEEADEFRQSAPSRAGADQAGGEVSNRAVSPPADPFGLPPVPGEEHRQTPAQAYAALADTAMLNCSTVQELDDWWLNEGPEREKHGIQGGKDKETGKVTGTKEYLDLLDKRLKLRAKLARSAA